MALTARSWPAGTGRLPALPSLRQGPPRAGTRAIPSRRPAPVCRGGRRARGLRDTLPSLEQRLRGLAEERRRQSAEKELAASERPKAHALRRASEADGTDERVPQEHALRMRAAL
jgi:hypothetical protein